MKKTLKLGFGTRPQKMSNFILLLAWLFYTFACGWGWAAGGIKIKANSVQFQLKQPVGTELGNKSFSINSFEIYSFHLFSFFKLKEGSVWYIIILNKLHCFIEELHLFSIIDYLL